MDRVDKEIRRFTGGGADVAFEAGNELQVLQTYRTAWLVKDEENRLFNIKKELAEEI